jgi:uncharacterized protein YkwD
MDNPDIVPGATPWRIIAITGALLGIAAVAPPALADTGPASPQRATASQAAIVRYVNAARKDHGLKPVRVDRKLARAALAHSRDMVAKHYFAHSSPSGLKFSARISRTGWMRGRKRWRVGETLAWGVGDNAAPKAVVQAWLHSRPHRKVVLSRQFRLIGLGIASGTPVGRERGGRTITADFGTAGKRRAPRGARRSCAC